MKQKWHQTAILLPLIALKSSPTIPIERSRLKYGSAIALVIAMGLLWRSGLLPLPPFLTKYGGDALWALVVFLCFGFVFCRSSTWRIVVAALGFTWSVEFLQLYHADWIDAIRSTRLGRLVLGTTFNGPDLIAYVIGIALGAFAECLYLNRSQKAVQIDEKKVSEAKS
jgi:hypothetical protein